MKKFLAVAASMFVMLGLGCATVPMQSFSPYTTSDGHEGWRMAVRGYDETTIAALLESDIGKSHMCPNGWIVTGRTAYQGFDLIEGECKKP